MHIEDLLGPESHLDAACAKARALARICDVLQGSDPNDDPREESPRKRDYAASRFDHYPPDGAFLTPEEF